MSEISYNDIKNAWDDEISNNALQNLADLRLSKMVSYLSKVRLELASTNADDVLQADLLSQQALNIEFMLKDLLEYRRNKILKAAFSNRKPTGDMTLAEEEFYKETQRALDSHIDFKIADNKVISDELLVKFEKSKYLPSLNAFINYSQFANNNNQIFYSGNWFDSSLFGVSLNVPIFSGFQRSSRTQQAKISLLQSEIELTETSEKLKLQVTTAKNKYQFALDQFQTAKQNLVLAESISNKEEIKFFEGISTSIDLTNAQNQLFNQQQNYIQSIFEIIQTKVELENALNIY